MTIVLFSNKSGAEEDFVFCGINKVGARGLFPKLDLAKTVLFLTLK